MRLDVELNAINHIKGVNFPDLRELLTTGLIASNAFSYELAHTNGCPVSNTPMSTNFVAN